MKQETAFKILQSGSNVFITGSAGTGKTHLLKRYIAYLRERRIAPAVVAPTGIAASHLGGQTIHSFFSLGLREEIDDGYVDSLREKKYLKNRFAKLNILIIDEISMVSPKLFSSMDRILRGFKEPDRPFGGVQVVISGDFFQLPPVSKSQSEKRFAWQSPAWKALDLQTCYLREKFRHGDERLIRILDDIRSGSVSAETESLLNERFDKALPATFTPTRLYTHNIDVDRINLAELAKLEDEPKVFIAETRGSRKNVDKIFGSSLVLEELVLKKGAVVIFIKNRPEAGYINGTTGIVEGFDAEDGLPVVRSSEGRRIFVDREEWSLENENGKVLASISQVPLRQAWAITVHKSQGMTLDAAEIDLSKTFEAGQGYVALSRIRSLEGLRLLGLNPMALQVDPLILHVDGRIEAASKKAEERLAALPNDTFERSCKEHILRAGGIIDTEEIAEEKARIGRGIPIHSTYVTPTHLKTKQLMEKAESVIDLAQKRGVSRGTIIKHLEKIKEEDPEIDLSRFRPDNSLCEKIKAVRTQLRTERREENFTADGKTLRLKPIFEALEGKVDYDTIRLCLLFIP